MKTSAMKRIEDATATLPRENPHVCPWWLGPFLASPLRRFFDNPDPILRELIKPGMSVADFGCGMGFHTLRAARLVGDQGRVISIDVQPRMIAGLTRRAKKAGLDERIDARVCPSGGSVLETEEGRVDLVLAVHVVHELPDAARAIDQLTAALRPGGKLFLAEPKGHVSEGAFEETLNLASAAGLRVTRRVALRRSRAAVLEKGRD